MNLLEYFILVNDVTTIFPDINVSSLSVYENSMLILFINLCIWIFIFILLSTIIKVVVRLK